MTERRGEPVWGPSCGWCGHPKLVHRGEDHDGTCAAAACATGIDARGMAKGSMCAAFVVVQG